MQPLLSVLIITYNHEDFVRKSIDSALAQKADFPFEIVIGDDHSTDGTTAIISEYHDRYPSQIFAVTHDQNVGVVENFFHTLARCRGKYIALLEGDDYWTDLLKLQKQVDFLETNAAFVLCGGHTVSENTSRKTLFSLVKHYKAVRSKTRMIETYDREEVCISNRFKTLTVVFRASLMEGFPASFKSGTILDWLIYIHLGMRAGPRALFANLPETFGVYTLHSGGIFSGIGQKKRLTVSAEVRKTIGREAGNAAYGFHFPLIQMEEAENAASNGSFNGPKALRELISTFSAMEWPQALRVAYEEKNLVDSMQFSEEIHKDKLTSFTGFVFARLFLEAKSFDEFTGLVAKLLRRINNTTPDTILRSKLLKAVATAWRDTMFYANFSMKTLIIFQTSLLKKYADIYLYSLILALRRNRKR
jgi:glycosyltransferase involved in cell wall biosynthesis